MPLDRSTAAEERENREMKGRKRKREERVGYQESDDREENRERDLP